ncbi:hypothetical protein MM1S1540310_3522 [Mycobacteroides abscessus subsp. bolletii 1S-154-0310]|uniref:Uncharacterized protein n=2 Tax=Mycobacteroides abscessus TaxID=36809 RepID=A0A829MG85_9MYCO|nr:hypothetical protein MASS_3905 [Mycobacteroides abscessus subsp. bolletii 50594]EIU63623.1 hypothetical protein MM1S1510930_3964 [Mycobacteroides abscessus subsp. bolletii 1S-151-0930]EIU67436.1 hypothetical protein MM1S1520914_4173 [Mycobacteroides abscessus subsp. bolletii 1S-152-0914]EIU74204.1 hypothetical protein MM1S1530915_3515 [Mycobacteroides abscessus subsp. bolletii 1S-153-0915]EIU78159.1 hypothetical protein MM2B0626_3779 [Mycobacteroides abscessus subsp. bolletii 2B-0626]EIU793
MESWFAMNPSGEELQTLQAEAGLPTDNSCIRLLLMAD